MNVEIITPDKKLFSGEAKSITLPGSDGSFGILEKHAPLVSSLSKGKVTITDANNKKQVFEINGGVAEVQNNNVTVLAE